MEITPRQLINLVRFTTGRRIYVMRQIRAAAVALGETDIVAHIDQATAHDRETLKIEARWRMRSEFGQRHAPEASEVDNRLDQALTSTRDVAQAYVRAVPEGDPKRTAGERFLRLAFPGGVFPITSLPYIEQLAAVEHMLDVIATELALEVAELSLSHMVSLVMDLTNEYRTVLDRGPGALEFSDVQLARDVGQENLCELVALVLGRFPRTREATDQQARTQLIGPILVQQEAIREYLRDRRAVPDVDPDGEPDGETGEPPLVEGSFRDLGAGGERDGVESGGAHVA